MKLLTLTANFICAAASLALAQTQTLPLLTNGSAYAQLASFLNLSTAQMQPLEQIQQQKAQATQAIYKQMADKQTQLTAALNAAGPDALQVGQLTLDIRSLQQQIPKAAAPFRQPALAVLSQDQVNKLATLVSALQLQSAASQAVALNLIDSQNGGIIHFAGAPAMPGLGQPMPVPQNR